MLVRSAEVMMRGAASMLAGLAYRLFNKAHQSVDAILNMPALAITEL
jgi:hypothetical protein